MYVEAKSKRKRSAKELRHLSIYAGDGASHEAPSWVVEHHYVSPAHEPECHEFSDHEEMLQHVRMHSGTEEPTRRRWGQPMEQEGEDYA